MPLRYKRKVKPRVTVTKFKTDVDHKLERDIRGIDKCFPVTEKKISKPSDLSSIISSLNKSFSKFIAPYVTGEYKSKRKGRKEILNDANKTVKFRYQLQQLSTHLNNFIFQLKMYLISRTNSKEEYEKLKKEISAWEEVVGKMLNDLISNISFIIQDKLVPVCENIEKEILKEDLDK